MAEMIFVNLPVRDLPRSIAFYEAVGMRKDDRFCDDTTAMMVHSDTISFMLLTHDRFTGFAMRPVADAHVAPEVLIGLSAESRADVDAFVEHARDAGASIDLSPPDDYGFMYGRNYQDLDGHLFNVVWMDVEAAMAARGDASAEPATA